MIFLKNPNVWTLTVLLLMVSPFVLAEQKAVLVTGATSGIGLKITQHLSAQGYFVYAGARKDADMERLNQMNNVQAVRLDVTKQDQIDAAAATVKAAGRGLHGIVNNAGVGVIWPLIEAPESEVQFQIDVNLFGPYRVTKAFAPMIIESKGRITTIGSISGVLSGKLFGVYSMSKHAVEAYTDSLALEMEKFGVRVSVIEPGNFQSKIGQNLKKRFDGKDYGLSQSLYQEDMERLINGIAEAEVQQQRADPVLVAEAVEKALFDEHPKRRYLVVPVEREAEVTIRKIIRETLELNQDHPFSYSREELIGLIDEEWNKLYQTGPKAEPQAATKD